MSSLITSSFAEDVRQSLQRTPRQLPSSYLYDALGSALFDAICELPWYGITRAENRLLAAQRQAIFAHVPGLTRLIDLGPGDGRKLRTLVAGTANRLTAHLVDVSEGALARAAHTLSDAQHVTVIAHRATFEEGIAALGRGSRHTDAQNPAADDVAMALLLGSNIGNFDPPASAALLHRIYTALASGDALLIGADLIKPEKDLLEAYNDPLGVSAAFNLNVLLRVNRGLGGNIDLTAFRHRAVWNARASRMEMFLVSTRTQRVRIAALNLEFDVREGESIWTESSYKFTADDLMRLLEDAGFAPVAQWIDHDDAFALTLARRP